MNSNDYEVMARLRAHRAEMEAAELRLKVRAVARRLGGRFMEEEKEINRIELGPTLHLWARRDWQKKEMIQWGARCPAVREASVPTVHTSVGRSVAAIAADLSRRLVPLARDRFKEAMASAGRMRDLERARWARIAELTEVLGPLRQTNDKLHYVDGFSIRHDELMRNYEARITAEVRVHSWHCLLMIARLVAEDARLHPKPESDE